MQGGERAALIVCGKTERASLIECVGRRERRSQEKAREQPCYSALHQASQTNELPVTEASQAHSQLCSFL